MFSPISVSIRTIALRMFFGFVFAGLVVASRTAQSEEDFFAPVMDLATIQSAITNTGAQHAYRLSTGIALTRSELTSPFGSEFGNPQGRSDIIDPQKNTAWTANPSWQFSPGGGSAFLSSLLRFESKADRIEIKPKRHSISFTWRKSF
ncbi:MAG: hypothetical protein Q7T21_15010 [Gallionella sp.]|nr:hypothetical protein [Gallionella sp.]